MAWKTLETYNLTKGAHVYLFYLNDISGGLFSNLLLGAFWLILTFASYFISKSQIGSGDLPLSLTVASILTVVLGVILSLMRYDGVGFVSGVTMTIFIVLTIISFLWLAFSRNN